MIRAKALWLALLGVAVVGLMARAQQPAPQNGLVWGVDSTGKSAPYVIQSMIPGGGKWISAFGKLDTAAYPPPKSISFDSDVLVMSVVKLTGPGGTPDPNFTEVIFLGGPDPQNGSHWTIDTKNRWNPSNGTTTVFPGFGPGNYRIVVKAKVNVVTMQPPPNPPTVAKHEAVLVTESMGIP